MFCKCTIKKQNQQGATAVEFALVLPLLLLLLFGIIEFSLYMFNKQVITNASREGARAGIVVRQVRMSDGDIEAIALSYCEQYLVTFGTKDISTKAGPAGRCLTFGCPLEVIVDFNYEFLFLNTIGISSTNIQSVAKMRME